MATGSDVSAPTTSPVSDETVGASAASEHAAPSPSETDVYADKSRVYTKTGDKGTTSLFNMARRSKADDYFDALGDTDELNANLGVVRAHCTFSPATTSDEHAAGVHRQLDEQLSEIQSRLFDVGAHLATPQLTSNEAQRHRTRFAEHHVADLEAWIDAMEASLPPLRNFILPGGGLVAAHLHVARAVCRRAERATVPIIARGDSEAVVGRYLNRLSDYLFVAARYAALASHAPETIWKKPREPRSPRKTAAAAAEATPADS